MTEQTPNEPESQKDVVASQETSAKSGLTDKHRNLIIVGVLLAVVAVLWFSRGNQPQNAPAGQGGGQDGGTEMTLAQYLVGTWRGQMNAAQGTTTFHADGSYDEQIVGNGAYPITSHGNWQVSGDALTMRVAQSNIPQRVGLSETASVEPISKSQCRVRTAGGVLVMNRVQ